LIYEICVLALGLAENGIDFTTDHTARQERFLTW